MIYLQSRWGVHLESKHQGLLWKHQFGGLFPSADHNTLVWVLGQSLSLCYQEHECVQIPMHMVHVSLCVSLMCLGVALLDSSFLAICHTFAAGYCARSV